LKDDRSMKLLLFGAGASIGVAIGILWAPASGAETRRKLAEKAQSNELVDKTRELYEAGLRMAEEAAELFEDGRKLVKG
jgi:gas vesicle protein